MDHNVQIEMPGRLLAAGGEDAVFHDGRWRSRDWMRLSAQAILDAAGQGALALVSRNRPHHVALMAGAIDAGRPLTMIHSAQSPARLAADIARLKRPAVVAEREDWTAETLAAAREVGSAAIAVADGETCAQVEVLLPACAAADFFSPPAGTAIELLSSGTTGAPKQIAISRDTVEKTLAASTTMYAGSAGNAPQIMCAPLGNVSGLGYAMPPMLNRQPLVLLDKFRPLEWAEAVHRFAPTRGSLPPAGIRMMLDADVPADLLASLEVVGVGGGKVDPGLQAEFERRYHVAVTPAYGATEFAGVVSAWTLDLYRQFGEGKRGSAGRAVPNARLRVVDAGSGREVPAGQEGLLEVQVDRIGPDWIRTTDLAHIDADGFLFLHGRADAAINRGGFKILPETIAAALCEHPAVADAAAIGIADARLGEVPVAAVELVPGKTATPEELALFLKDRLLAYQQPVQVRVLDSLPRNPSLKVALAELKVLFT